MHTDPSALDPGGRGFALGLWVALLLGGPGHVLAQQIEVISRGIHTLLRMEGEQIEPVRAWQGVDKRTVVPDPGALDDPNRTVIIDDGERTVRIEYRNGHIQKETQGPSGLASGLASGLGQARQTNRTWPTPSAPLNPLNPRRPPSLRSPETYLGSISRPESPVSAREQNRDEPSREMAPVGRVQHESGTLDAAFFGGDSPSAAPPPFEEPGPLKITGVVEALIHSQEPGPSPNLGPMGSNTALETNQGIFNMDASMGDGLRFLGQLRIRRALTADLRIAKIMYTSPKGHSVSIGRDITPFGLFPVFNLPDRNPLFGFPLPYEYQTHLSPAAVPAGPAAFLANRGTGGGSGLAGPAIYQGFLTYGGPIGERGSLSVGLSNGSAGLGEPLARNDALGAVTRIGFNPSPIWNMGFSFHTAPYMDSGVRGLAPGERAEEFRQNLFGFDLQYAEGPIVIRSEVLHSRWDISQNVGLGKDLFSIGFSVGGKLRIGPRWFFAARLSGLRFQDVPSPTGRDIPWDLEADRGEIVLGHRPAKNLIIKLAFQKNHTYAQPQPNDDRLVLQVLGRF